MFGFKVTTAQSRFGLTPNLFCYLVCTTTVWVGQLDKKTQRSDVMALLEEFGQIESINVSNFMVNIFLSYSYYEQNVFNFIYHLVV